MNKKEIENQRYYAESIRNNYVFAFSLLNIAIWLEYISLAISNNVLGEIPVYWYCYFAFSIITWIILFVQIKREAKKFSMNLINKYIIINTIVGYNIPFGYGNVYFFNLINYFNLLNIWLVYFFLVVLSVFGLYVFGSNAFKENKSKKFEVYQYIGGILTLLSIVSIMVLNFNVPTLYGGNKDLLFSGILVFCVHLLMIRTIAFYVFLKESIKEHGVLI
ncbi:hypothetical protein [Staphylococcus sp. EZ-P03]|uniref:hypothetical protein n=1 Tax=Staphylococcus sp. EZ-P03 TaxID=2282739 RepID=UPI000DF84B48|nr:hypothetical protein [Staphylococcus sp. EZ-P03]